MEKTNRPNAPLPQPVQYGWRDGDIPKQVMGHAIGSGAGGTASKPVPPGFVELGGAVLYQKRIDNGNLNFRHDPRDRDTLRWHISLGLFVLMMVLLITGPRLWVRQSGYRQADLAATIEQLIVVRDQLKVEKGRREELARIAEYAQQIGMRETDEDRYTWFAPEPAEEELGHTVARLFDSPD